MQPNPYIKTIWQDHIIDPTFPENDPNRIIQQGTRFTARRANNIEEGIYDLYNRTGMTTDELIRVKAEMEMLGRAPINNGSFLDVLDGTDSRNMVPQDEKAVVQAALTSGLTTIQLDTNPFLIGTVVTIYDDTNQEDVKITGKNGASITVTPVTKSYKKGANIARSNAVIIGKEMTFGTWGTFTVTATEVV